MSYVLIGRKYLYFESFKYKAFGIVFEHKEERKSETKVFGALLYKLLFHLRWKHLYQLQSFFDLKSTVDF